MSAMALSASAAVNNADTLRVPTTPQMRCEKCANKIKTNIRFVKGVKKIDTSVSDQQVTIVYDKSKSNYEDFVAAFKKIGYNIQTKPQTKK